MMHPKLFERPKCESYDETMKKKKKVVAHSLACNISKVRGHARAPRWD
jgi:hypothetical protein